MRKTFLILYLLLALFLLGCTVKRDDVFVKNGASMIARVHNDEFQVYHQGEFRTKFLTGVNIGAGMPGSFPGELAITQEMYYQWFEDIYAMNADVIRVYTAMKPHFYQALYEFNQTVEIPLYLMQGVWVNEDDIKNIQDPFAESEKIMTDFIQDSKDLVDIIHGNATLEERAGYASGEYTYDISNYVIGWILGIEWDPLFVKKTNDSHLELTHYQGKYISTSYNVEAFEVFLAKVGDEVVKYETQKYRQMRPLSFVNWPTTDHLKHLNEPDLKEDLVSVNMNHIHANKAFTAGYFASFHVYPYYPEFLNYSVVYRQYRDQYDEINPYQAYLKDLKSQLDMPVFITEFGVPASRGKTHEDINRGFNQGNLTEIEQGEIAEKLIEDIYVSDYEGAFLFTWQDEWFKRTWNTMDLDLPSRRPYWSNYQTNEQYFGVMAFEPGNTESVVYVDGDISEWDSSSPLISSNNLLMDVKYDERYVYLRVSSEQFSSSDKRLIIGIQTNPNQGNTHINDTEISFSKPINFYIEINSNIKGELYVDAYYDPFYFMYHEKLHMLDKIPEYRKKNNGIFNSIYQALSAELYLPELGIIVPFMKHNTGLLTYGIANPGHKDYNSLADYYIDENNLEIKIPWLLLNISDPSSKMRLADFYQYDWFESESIESIFFGAAFVSQDETAYINLYESTWDAWEQPTYHTRLKQSYEIIKTAYKRYQ